MSQKVMLEIELSDEFLDDVIEAALAGGIQYWASIMGRSGKVYAIRDDDEGKRMLLTHEAVARGITKALSKDFCLNDTIRATIYRGASQSDAGDIDAEAADVIVQAAMFGGIVYS